MKLLKKKEIAQWTYIHLVDAPVTMRATLLPTHSPQFSPHCEDILFHNTRFLKYEKSIIKEIKHLESRLFTEMKHFWETDLRNILHWKIWLNYCIYATITGILVIFKKLRSSFRSLAKIIETIENKNNKKKKKKTKGKQPFAYIVLSFLFVFFFFLQYFFAGTWGTLLCPAIF